MEDKQTIKEKDMQVILAVNDIGMQHILRGQQHIAFMQNDGTFLSVLDINHIVNKTLNILFLNTKVEN